MNRLEELLKDNGDEKLTASDPVAIWVDIFTDELAGSGIKGVIKIPSKELHDMYVGWVEQLNEPSYLYNQIQFMVRLSRLKIDGVKTGIHTKTCKMCSFDTDKLKILTKPQKSLIDEPI